MGTLKKIFIVSFIILFFSNVTAKTDKLNHSFINISEIIEKLKELKPIFIYPQVYEKIRYEHLYITTINLIKTYASLIEKYKNSENTENKNLVEQIKIVENLILKIEGYLDYLSEIYLLDLENTIRNLNPDQQDIMNSQTQITIQQQAMISDLIETIEESNNTISNLTQKDLWRKAKILGAVILGTTILAGIIVGSIIFYKNFFYEVDKEIDKIEEKGTQVKKEAEKIDHAMKAGEVSETTKQVLENTKIGINKIEDLKKNTLEPMKKKIDERVVITRLLKAHSHDHEYIADRMLEFVDAINYMKKKIQKYEKKQTELTQELLKVKESCNCEIPKENKSKIEKINKKLTNISEVISHLYEQIHTPWTGR